MAVARLCGVAPLWQRAADACPGVPGKACGTPVLRKKHHRLVTMCEN